MVSHFTLSFALTLVLFGIMSGMSTAKGVVNVQATEKEVAEAVAEYVANLSSKFAQERGIFTVVVGAGSVIHTLRKLVEEPYSKSVDWSKWQVFWVDERMVPLTDKESNYKLAYDGFLSKVPIPPTNIHAVNVTLPAPAAAEAYQTLIKTLVDNKTIDSSSSSGSPRFDLMLLSMGPDGHVASLFPGHPLLKEKQRWVAAVEDAPFLPRERVTFTFPVINSAANFAFMITASDLPEWVKAMLADKVEKAVNGRGCGEGEGLLLPVEMVKPRGEMRWFLDKSTAAKIEG
ncbi:probable 6-phosphogluconolactonase 4, chloroplastic [Rhododendron vialii]|uniref:probable 6-phosphogluconolactonase 4, chloroplastic n=1 Tax=Rhododendron vialii TaxID=182163 RepID=UPI00265F077D|nr:probable 6-phosphogluconolactonase 4, chloroplastic [Rhododendron vialii]